MNKPRNRSTNLASLNKAVSAIQSNISPIISIRPAPDNPGAQTRTRDKWIRRKVRLQYGNVTTSFQVKNGELVTELGGTDVLAIKILGFTVWNTTGPKNTTNYVFVESAAVLTTSGIRSEAQDWGNGAKLAGLRMKIPKILAGANGAGPLQQTNILFVTCSPASTTFDPQSICIDVDCLVNTSATQ